MTTDNSMPSGNKPAMKRSVTGFLFTMALLLLLLFLIACIVLPRCGLSSPDAMRTAARIQIAAFGTALDIFHMDNGYFPRSPDGLKSLVQRPPEATNWHGPCSEANVALYFMHYNFCRIHQTLRVTPAMEAGIVDHVWTMAEIVQLLEVD